MTFPEDGTISETLWSRICYRCLGPGWGGWGFRLSLSVRDPNSGWPGAREVSREWFVTRAEVERSEREGALDGFLMTRRLEEERALLRELTRRPGRDGRPGAP